MSGVCLLHNPPRVADYEFTEIGENYRLQRGMCRECVQQVLDKLIRGDSNASIKIRSFYSTTEPGPTTTDTT
jgi:hypothetical protein